VEGRQPGEFFLFYVVGLLSLIALSVLTRKEEELGFLKTRLGIQADSRARCKAASGIVAHATSGRHAPLHSSLKQESWFYSLQCVEKRFSQVRTYRVLGNTGHARPVDRQSHVSSVRSVAAGSKGVKGG
jgi:hypothetical protein